MVNIQLLEQEMKRKNVSNADIAAALNIDISTWSRKKARPMGIKIGEVEQISALLKLSKNKAKSIFLPSVSQKMRVIDKSQPLDKQAVKAR